MEAVRIAEFSITEGRRGEALQNINDLLIPAMQASRGFRRGYWLLDDATGQAIAVTVWQSEAARAAFGTSIKQRMEESGALQGTVIRDLPLVATVAARSKATVTA